MWSRRKALGVLAASPIAGKAAAEQALTGIKTGLDGNQYLTGGLDYPVEEGGRKKFTDFAKWFTDVGDEQARQQADMVTFLDPDIAGFSLPLATKKRMQSERNYRRILEDRKTWFAKTLKTKGFIEWWM